MKILLKIILKIVLFVVLTLITQIGGIVYLLSLIISRRWNKKLKLKTLIIFIGLYLLSTFLIVPLVAPNFGKQEIRFVFFRALGNFSSFGFFSFGIEGRKKPKVLKYVVGQYETQRFCV